MRARAVPMPRIYHRRPYNRPMTVARHSRTFPARRDALPQVDAFLDEVCAAAGLGRETCLRLTLLVEELGVLLVRAMAQQVEYRRAGDRNLISLVISTIA